VPVLLSALDVLLAVAIVGGLIAGLVVVLNRRPVLGPTVSRYAAIGLGVPGHPPPPHRPLTSDVMAGGTTTPSDTRPRARGR
jgi:hypothetical protein